MLKRWFLRQRRVLLLSAAALALAAGGLSIRENREESLSVSGSAGAGQEEIPLYAQSAVLMDAGSGRILYGKEADRPMPMASTTKIMTLIVALEYADGQETATVSSYAASQPKVRLGMQEGQRFRLGDLYYSLMLESHNDTAVCIAEHVGRRILEDSQLAGQGDSRIDGQEDGQTDGQGEGQTGGQADAGKSGQTGAAEEPQPEEAVEAFLDRMNEKAEEIGCTSTCFLTPNGLDAEREEGGEKKIHSTTAGELALILRYCMMESPKKEEFLSITRTPSYSFQDLDGKKSYSCTNHNAFLDMMEGALTGKTGFTAKAGYCYVGALRQGERTFIVSLLACGWPNNKNYKWTDTRALMEYGLENYEYREVYRSDLVLNPVRVDGGVPASGIRTDTAYADLELPPGGRSLQVLLKEGEEVQVSYEGVPALKAPVQAGEKAGEIRYRLGDWEIAQYPVTVKEDVPKLTFAWCLGKLVGRYVPVV